MCVDGLKSGINPHTAYTCKQSRQSRTQDQMILATQTRQPVCLGNADKTQRSHADAESWTSVYKNNPMSTNHHGNKVKCLHAILGERQAKNQNKLKKRNLRKNKVEKLLNWFSWCCLEFPNIMLAFHISVRHVSF